MIDLAGCTVASLRAAYAAGTTDARELVDTCLAGIAADEHGAFVHVADDAARAAAETAAARIAAGTARPLEGVPIGVKDIVDVADQPTTAGTDALPALVPARSATAVQRLVDAGAIVVGKTATPEWAFGDAVETHRPRNPWGLTRWTGGSSSGSAVALAAGLVPLTVGTDTGGSIRVPASYCGVAGIKPTTGAVPRDGVRAVSWTQDHVGPMARNAADLATALAIMAGPTPADPAARRAPLAEAPASLDGLRVGILDGWFTERAEPAVLDARDAAMEVLRAAGAQADPAHLDDADLAPIASWTISVAEFAAQHDGEPAAAAYTPMARERLLAGQGLAALDYLRALRARAVVQTALDAAFDRFDVLVSPATPTSAPVIAPPEHEMFEDGDRMWLEWVARNFLIANVTGIPAVVVPLALDAAGLPVAMQVLAPPGADLRALAVAEVAAADGPGVPRTLTRAGGSMT